MELSFSTAAAIETAATIKDAYDVVIIGAGPAGLSAAIYAKRKGLSTLLVTEKSGGQVTDTTSVENYAGFESISGEKLANKFIDHAKSLDVDIREFSKVNGIARQNKSHSIQLDDGTAIEAKAVIIATGSKPRKLNVPGELEYSGRGVAYCAICDGPLFAGKDVVVSGGGNSAVEAAMDLAKIVNSVTIVHRSQFRADRILLDQLDKLDNVSVHLQTEIKSIEGEKLVTGLTAFDKKANSAVEFKTDGIFVEIGYLPNTAWLGDLVQLNKRGEIITNAVCETSVPGIFAAGDVTDTPYKQIIIAAADGAKAALTANDYINKL